MINEKYLALFQDEREVKKLTHGVPATTHGERIVLAINATRNLNVS